MLYLQLQLMTRQLRYSSSIDTTEFEKRVVAAAKSCFESDSVGTKNRIQSCFDLLFINTERQSYCGGGTGMQDVMCAEQRQRDLQLVIGHVQCER